MARGRVGPMREVKQRVKGEEGREIGVRTKCDAERANTTASGPIARSRNRGRPYNSNRQRQRPIDKSRNLRPRHDEVACRLTPLGGSRRMTGLRVTTRGEGRAGADGWASVCDLGTTWSRLPQTTAASRGLGSHFVTALPTAGNGQTAEGRRGHYMQFCETNPPFLAEIFGATSYLYDTYV